MPTPFSAVFAGGALHATDKLDVTVGIRGTEDDREIDLVDISATSGGGNLAKGIYKLSTGFVVGGILNGIA